MTSTAHQSIPAVEDAADAAASDAEVRGPSKPYWEGKGKSCQNESNMVPQVQFGN